MIIHPNVTLRRSYLLNKINIDIDKNFDSIAQLFRNPDIHIIDNGEGESIKIEDIKSLQKEMIFQPFQEIKQLAVIFYSQNLTAEAQNALLKTLEEQSETTNYYLLVNNEKNLLDTIISRSIKHYVKADREPKAGALDIARPEIFNLPIYKQFIEIDKIINTDKEDGIAVKAFLLEILSYLRQTMKESARQGNSKQLKTFSRYIHEVSEAQERISRNVNKKLALENLILSIRKKI
ncbi:hypothetical protein H6764_01470 [Candidatus Nomurabacteria bacterium]|nr:hypothetical protein [Candidatus Nomurabacteria bacterium]